MITAYKFRLYPTVEQDGLLLAELNDMRFLYNAALEDRRYMWKRYRIGIKFPDQDAQLTAIRAYDPDYARWPYDTETQVLRRVNQSYQAFFRRVKAGERKPGHPRYKGAGWFDTVDHRNGRGCKWIPAAQESTWARVYLQGVGYVKVKQHRPVEALRITRVAVKREGRKWYVILCAEQDQPEPLPKTGAMVGIDMATGDNGLAYTSSGERIDNPAYRRASEKRLAVAQRALSRTKKGSNRHRKAKDKVAGVHRKTRRQRRDYLNKVSRRLVDSYDVIVMEDLNTAGMTRRPAPRPDGAGGYEPNGGSAKTGLNRSILDAGWGILQGMIRNKAESAGRELILVNPAYTSRICPNCGHRDAANRNGKVFLCLSCGYREDADFNAADNILRAGLALRDTS